MIKPLFISVLSFFLILAFSAQAEGPLRAKIKDRMREHVVQKLEERPEPQVTASLSDKLIAEGDFYFSIQHGGLNRMYRVHVPASYSPVIPSALVFAFHGGGGSMDYMANDEFYGLITKSDKEGFVIVFPNGYSKFPSGKFATWNAGNCCGDARDKNIDDIGFVKAIIANLKNQMNIDQKRIFAIGMSNGGMMSERLACEMADTFKAIASVAGTDNTRQCSPARPISVLNIHARNDDHVKFDGGAGEGAFKDPSKVTEFISVPETVSRWVKRNHCAEKPDRILSLTGAYCDLYGACDGGAKIQLCVTEAGGHSWPGGHKPRGETPSKAISANDEIWKFFMSLN